MLKILCIVFLASGVCAAEKQETVILDGKEVLKSSLTNPVEYMKEPTVAKSATVQDDKPACVT